MFILFITMKIKRWLARMGWMGLCSASLALTNRYTDAFTSADLEEMFSIIPDGSVVPIADDDQNSDESSEDEEYSDSDEDSDEDFVDLSPLHSVICDEDRDLLEGKGRHAKRYRYLLRLLRKYLLDILEEEDTEGFVQDNEEMNMERLFPTARQLKAEYTSEELHRINIDFERLLEIELLLTLPKLRPFTKREDSLLKKATRTLDCHSPERRILYAIREAPQNPQKALEIVKSTIEAESLDMNSVYIGLRSSECGSSFLLEAARVKQNKGLEIVRFFLDNGVDVNTLTDYGNYEAYGIDTPSRNTALHYAAREGNVKVAKLLIDRGADVNVRDSQGWTPLHEAMYFDYFKVAKLLLDHGADRDIQNNEGKTAFEIAIEYKDKERRKFDAKIEKLRSYTP
jgi:hypothetical protein